MATNKRYYRVTTGGPLSPIVDWPKHIYTSGQEIDEAWRDYCTLCARKGLKPSDSLQGPPIIWHVHAFSTRKAADEFDPMWDKFRSIRTL